MLGLVKAASTRDRHRDEPSRRLADTLGTAVEIWSEPIKPGDLLIFMSITASHG